MKNETKKYNYLLIFAMLLWGGGWSALKILTSYLPLEVVIFWRFLIMSLAFLPILVYLKKPIIVTKNSLKFILGSATLNISFMIFSFFGIKYGLAGGGSVIITTFTPIVTFLFVVLLFKKRVNSFQKIGLILGLIGGYILLELDDISSFLDDSNIFFLLSSATWAGVTILSQHSQKHINPIHYSFVISVVATIVTFLYGLHADLFSVFSQGLEFWIALIYLAIFSQAVATTIFFVASGKLGSEKTSSFMFLVPIFALFLAWLILDEELQLHIVIGGTISMIAVYFINKK